MGIFLASTVDIRGEIGGLGSGPQINTDFGQLLASFIGAIYVVGALLLFAYLIHGGFKWITSGGDKSKTESARGEITQAITGFALMAASFAIFALIQYFFGIDIVQL